MGRVPRLVALLAVVAAPVLAGGFSFSTSFTPRDFGELADTVSAAIAFPCLTTAAPSGPAGFAMIAVAGGPHVDTGAHWWRSAVDARTVGAILPAYRAIVRKGLPWGVDLGAQVGRVAGERFWGGEVRYNVFGGGLLEPAAGLRLAYARLDGAPVALDVTEAQVLLSKGFTAVSPFVAAGYARTTADARFGDPISIRHHFQHDHWTGTVGVRLAVAPLLHVVAEVRRSTVTSLAVGFGVGL